MNRIQMRRGTTVQWTTSNPILAMGEPGLDTTTGDYKIGDGVTTWTSLPLRYQPNDSDLTAIAALTTTAYGRSLLTVADSAALMALQATAWTAVTFAGTWVNFGAGNQTVQYRKVGDMVQMRGIAKSGTTATTVFTLPVGFRPPAPLNIPSMDATSVPTAAIVSVSNSGVVAAFCTVITAIAFEFQFSVTA